MSELTPSLCKCTYWARTSDDLFNGQTHHPKCDGTGKWKDVFRSPPPSPPDDLEGSAREFYLQRRLGLGDDCEKVIEIMASFAAERIADAVPKWVRVEDRLPPCARTYGDLKDKPYVLVVDTKGRTAVAYPVEYSNPKDGVRWVSGKAIGQVVAWMPIPPYVQREARKDD